MAKSDKKRVTSPTQVPQQYQIQIDIHRQLMRVTTQRNALMERNDMLETALEQSYEELQKLKEELDNLAEQMGENRDSARTGNGGKATEASASESGGSGEDEGDGDGSPGTGRKHRAPSGQRG